jgi:hypothetical protein
LFKKYSDLCVLGVSVVSSILFAPLRSFDFAQGKPLRLNAFPTFSARGRDESRPYRATFVSFVLKFSS